MQMYDLENRRRVERLSVRDALVRTDHNSVVVGDERNDHLEHEWQRVESEMLPFIRRMVDGDLHPADEPQAVVALMAVHLARAAGTEAVHDRIIAEALQEQPEIMAKNRKLRGMAHPDAIREATRTALNELIDSRQLRVDGMARHYNWFCERFASYSVQLVTARNPGRVGFITSDNPTVLCDGRRIRVGVQQVAVMDASEVFIALGPGTLVALCKKRVPDVTLLPAEVQKLNHLIRRAAIRWLVAHPSQDLSLAAL